MASPDLRPLTDDDMPAVCELINLSNAHDGRKMLMEVDEVREDIGPPTVQLASDTLAAVAGHRLVGVAWTNHIPSETIQERCYVFGHVHPEHRFTGIGQQLMSWGVQRADEQLSTSRNSLPKYVRAEALDSMLSRQRLFTRFGLRPIRYFDDLARPLTELPAVPKIEGIRIVAWPAERSGEIRAVKNAAFESHWGSTPATEESWRQSTEGFGARTDLSFVAVDRDDIIVGLLLSHRYEADDELLGYKQGYIDKIGTLARWRGRGIASALIIAALYAYAAAGLTHAALDVDSDSPTGANRLYASIGFAPRTRSITYERIARAPRRALP